MYNRSGTWGPTEGIHCYPAHDNNESKKKKKIKRKKTGLLTLVHIRIWWGTIVGLISRSYKNHTNSGLDNSGKITSALFKRVCFCFFFFFFFFWAIVAIISTWRLVIVSPRCISTIYYSPKKKKKEKRNTILCPGSAISIYAWMMPSLREHPKNSEYPGNLFLFYAFFFFFNESRVSLDFFLYVWNLFLFLLT